MGSVSALRGRTVLVVEDECLIALDIAEQLSVAGAQAVLTRSVEQALGALASLKFAAAIVDHRLGDGDACEVIRRLEKLQIPFLIHSGYEEVEAWANAPVVRKPATRDHLIYSAEPAGAAEGGAHFCDAAGGRSVTSPMRIDLAGTA